MMNREHRDKDNPQPWILVLDIGSSATRASVWDARSCYVPQTMTRAPTRWRTDDSGAAEDDPQGALARVCTVVDGALAKLGEQAEHLAAVALDTYAANTLGLDKAGQPITPVYTYADRRGARQAAALRAQLDEPAIHDRTGCRLHPSYLPVRFRWLQQTQPRLWQRVARWSFLDGYLLEQLTDRPAPASYSLASWNGLLDRRELHWDEAILEVVGICPEQLPQLADCGQDVAGLAGPWADRWPPLAELPWFPAIGDGAAANVGSGCCTEHQLALSIGSTSALRMIAAEDPAQLATSLWCYRVDSDLRLVGGALSEGGNLLSWLSKQMNIELTEELKQTVASQPPAVHGLTVLPFVSGERSPGWATQAKAAIAGLSLSTTAADLVRAALEAVAYRLAAVHDSLSGYAAGDAEIIGSGGALRAWPMWGQIMADATGRPVSLCGQQEATSRGTAVLALRSLGVIEAIDSLLTPRGQSFVPRQQNYEAYRQARASQHQLYESVVNRAD